MPRRSSPRNPESLRTVLIDLLADFSAVLQAGELRQKVKALIPAHRILRDMGSSLIPAEIAGSARERILQYLLAYPYTIIAGEELMIVAGISEWARRVRELRVQLGWPIISGETAKEMVAEGELELESLEADVTLDDLSAMKPDQYVMLGTQQDREAAHRWNLANEIRRKNTSARDKILDYFRANVGSPVTGEELKYVAHGRTEWARRVRELRTEYGWPIVSRNTGKPDLPVGVYMLEEDRQSPEHDRSIKDTVRREVLRRDGYTCTDCGWSHEQWNKDDPRHLELHHIKPHVEGGGQEKENLTTLCTVCHKRRHSR